MSTSQHQFRKIFPSFIKITGSPQRPTSPMATIQKNSQKIIKKVWEFFHVSSIQTVKNSHHICSSLKDFAAIWSHNTVCWWMLAQYPTKQGSWIWLKVFLYLEISEELLASSLSTASFNLRNWMVVKKEVTVLPGFYVQSQELSNANTSWTILWRKTAKVPSDTCTTCRELGQPIDTKPSPHLKNPN